MRMREIYYINVNVFALLLCAVRRTSDNSYTGHDTVATARLPIMAQASHTEYRTIAPAHSCGPYKMFLFKWKVVWAGDVLMVPMLLVLSYIFIRGVCSMDFYKVGNLYVNELDCWLAYIFGQLFAWCGKPTGSMTKLGSLCVVFRRMHGLAVWLLMNAVSFQFESEKESDNGRAQETQTHTDTQTGTRTHGRGDH